MGVTDCGEGSWQTSGFDSLTLVSGALARVTRLVDWFDGRSLARVIDSMTGANDGFACVSDSLALVNASIASVRGASARPGGGVALDLRVGGSRIGTSRVMGSSSNKNGRSKAAVFFLILYY